MRRFKITVEGTAYEVTVEELDDEQPSSLVTNRPAAAAPRVAQVPQATGNATAPKHREPTSSGDITSPLSGTVTELRVSVGQSVSVGACLLTLEAMKMESEIVAHIEGTVVAIPVSQGQAVQEGETLLQLAPA